MRTVDKNKKVNVKCEHCDYYDSDSSFCNLLCEPKNYYNRCMKFKWSNAMVKYVDECVRCDDRCLGSSCPNRNVKHLYCDECDDEVEELYNFEGIQLCEKCLLKKFEKIT